MNPALKGGGNCKYICNFCDKPYNGSHSRVKHHLLKISGEGIKVCRMICNEKRRELENLMNEVEARKKDKQQKLVPLPSGGRITIAGLEVE